MGFIFWFTILRTAQNISQYCKQHIIPMYGAVLTNLSDLVLFFVKIKDEEKEKVDAFFALNSYVKGSYDQKEAFVTLNAALCKLEEGFAGGNRLFYLSPPSFGVCPSDHKPKRVLHE